MKAIDREALALQLKTWSPYGSRANTTAWQKETARLEALARTLGGLSDPEAGLHEAIGNVIGETFTRFALLRRTLNGLDAVIRPAEIEEDIEAFEALVLETTARIAKKGGA